MATREEVYSLFGIKSPAQVMAERRAAQQAEADQLSGAGQAGYGLGTMFGRALGFQTPEEIQSEKMAQAVQGIDPNDPAQLRELAKTVSSFAPEAALRMLTEAKTLETPQYSDVKVQVMVPEFDALKRKVGEVPKTITRTGVFVNGKLTGYVDGQGGTIPLAATTTTGIFDTPEAKASRASVAPQEDANVKNLGDEVTLRLKTDGTTPISDDQMKADQASAPQVVAEGITRKVATPEDIARLEANTTGPGVPERAMDTAEAAPDIAKPAVKGQVEYADPDQLELVGNNLRDEIVALENSNDPNKAAKIDVLKKRRAQVQKLRLASRRKKNIELPDWLKGRKFK